MTTVEKRDAARKHRCRADSQGNYGMGNRYQRVFVKAIIALNAEHVAAYKARGA